MNPVTVFVTVFVYGALASTLSSMLPSPNTNIDSVVDVWRFEMIPPSDLSIIPRSPPMTDMFQFTLLASASPLFLISTCIPSIPPMISPISSSGPYILILIGSDQLLSPKSPKS